MNFDPLLYRFPSRRNAMYAKRGMVGSSSPLAAQAGLEILKKGGNAIDAAIATAAALTVVEPSANGIGGDGFAIVHHGGKIHGMNSSGPAPALISGEALKSKGQEKEIEKYGLDPVTVPGIPAGWAALSEKFGRLSLSEVVEPAAFLAENGYAVSAALAVGWKRTFNIYTEEIKKQPVLKHWFETFCPDGKPMEAGDIFRSQAHASTLREIGKTNAESFYRGNIANAIDKFSRENGGYLRKEDLMAFSPEWIAPLSTNYRGYDVWELPPNTQGLVVLSALNIAENFTLKSHHDIETIHRQIESMKLAFSDGKAYIGDTTDMKVNVGDLISKEYAKERAKLIGYNALEPTAGAVRSHGTVYMATADGEGNMVSYIQSNYTGFGSGSVVPGYGIALHNRGSQFSLDETHPNYIKPGKRPYHTIIPGFLTKDNKPIGSFGVMGGPLQPQAHMQVINNLIDFNMNPQEALDAPRWQWISGKKIQIEGTMPFEVIEALIRRGHDIEIPPSSAGFGRGQIILQTKEGSLVGGTEPRTDGHLAIW